MGLLASGRPATEPPRRIAHLFAASHAKKNVLGFGSGPDRFTAPVPEVHEIRRHSALLLPYLSLGVVELVS
jgi:hypothetical protein